MVSPATRGLDTSCCAFTVEVISICMLYGHMFRLKVIKLFLEHKENDERFDFFGFMILFAL